MKSFTFGVVVVPDEDALGNPAWHAYCPALECRGIARNSLTARELIAALGRRVTVAPHGNSDTFTIKTLKSMLERQVNWTAEDLLRLRLIRK